MNVLAYFSGPPISKNNVHWLLPKIFQLKNFRLQNNLHKLRSRKFYCVRIIYDRAVGLENI